MAQDVGQQTYPKASTLVSLCYHLLCCSTPRSETHLPPRCSRASVYRSTCAGWRWADYHIRWIGTLRWAPTLVSARTTRLNKGRSSAQHVDHLTQNRRCLPPTRVAFEHLATAVVAGYLIGRVRLATPTTHHYLCIYVCIVDENFHESTVYEIYKFILKYTYIYIYIYIYIYGQFVLFEFISFYLPDNDPDFKVLQRQK